MPVYGPLSTGPFPSQNRWKIKGLKNSPYTAVYGFSKNRFKPVENHDSHPEISHNRFKPVEKQHFEIKRYIRTVVNRWKVTFRGQNYLKIVRNQAFHMHFSKFTPILKKLLDIDTETVDKLDMISESIMIMFLLLR